MAQKTDAEKLVAAILEETKPARDEHGNRVKVFNKCYEVYRPKAPSRGPYASMMRVPFAQSNIDTALVNIVQDAPRCLVLPRTPDYTQKARKFQLVMDYYSERDHLVEKMAPIAQQALVYGLAIGKVRWRYETGSQTKRRVVDDVYSGTRKFEHYEDEVVIYDGPTLDVWNVYDAWWDPNGRDVDECDYFCLRSYVTKAHLMQNACSIKGKHDHVDCNGIYHNVEELLNTGAPKNTSGQTAQEQRQKRSHEARRGRFEIVEVWRDHRLSVYGNDQVLLRDAPNPHWHGRKPIVAANTRPDMLEIAGVPETEMIDHLQQALWTIQNLRVENELLTVQRMFTYRESSTIDPKKVKLGPRALIGVTDHDDLRPVETQPLPPEAFHEEEALLGLIQLITGISPYVTGANSAQIDQNTATGISVLSEVAGRLLKFKASQLHWKCWQRMFELWGNDIQQFMDKDIAVRIINDDTGEPGWSKATPEDTVGEFDFTLAAGGESSSKQQRRSEVLQLLQALAPFIQLGVVNVPALLERTGETFDFINPRELIQPPPNGQQPVAAPTPNGGPPPAMGPGPTQTPALDPAMLQMLGTQPGVMQGQQ